MPEYKYKAMNQAGKVSKGSISARSKSDVKKRLMKMRLKTLSITLEKDSIEAFKESDEEQILGKYIYKDSEGRIQIALGNDSPTTKHIIVFTKQLSTMLNSGVPLIQSLTILASQQPSRGFKSALTAIRASVENGASLSESMEDYPSIFDPLFIAMVRAGEATGNLDVILMKLVSYIEKAAKIKSQIKSAMMYPIIVVAVAIAVISALLLFVVPVFAEQYADSGRELPFLTQVVIDFSAWISGNWYVVILLGIIVGGLMKIYIKTDDGRVKFDGLLLKSPVLGDLLRKIAVGRFCSTMSSMLTSGVNLLEALSICAASSGNKVIENFIFNAKDSLEKGNKLSDPLSEGDLFPDMVISMVSVGEATGALDEMLEKVSEFYEEEVDLAVQTMLSMIEPIMIVGIGGVVGFIVIAMYLPIFDMASNVTG